MKKKFERIVSYVDERPAITLESFVSRNPDIASGTYHQALGKLRKCGLVTTKALGRRRVVYSKTDRFTVRKALEILGTRRTQEEHIEPKTLEERVQETVEKIVDPASGLTFAEMKVDVNVERKSPMGVDVEFFPSFCPLATELASYIEKAIDKIPYAVKAQIYCRGYSSKKAYDVSESNQS